MHKQEIQYTHCSEDGLNKIKKEQNQNRITIDQIPNNGMSTCSCQLSKDQKSNKCHKLAKCNYQLTNELRQLVDITLYNQSADINIQNLSIEAIAYKKFIECIRDFNSIKDENDEHNLKLKLINKCIDQDGQDNIDELIKENYPKIAAQLEEYQHDQINNFFRKIAISLQDQFDQILNGEETFFFFFLNKEIDWSIQKSIQFLQRANLREIETQYLNSQESTTYEKLKSEHYKISLVSIQKNRLDLEPSKKDNLQFLNFYYEHDDYQEKKIINTTHLNYNVPIDNSLDQLKVVQKFFIKEKLKDFQPTFIVFYFEISNNFIKDPQVFYQLVKKFHKISQGRLIIIPKIDPNIQSSQKEIIIQYLNCANYCFLGCFQGLKTQKLDQNNLIENYKRLYPYFVEKGMIQKKQFYQRQLTTLKIQNPKVADKQSRQNLHRQFPLIDKDGNAVLLDLGQEFDFNQLQYFVEYDQKNNQYDGFIVLIEKHRIQVIFFNEQGSRTQIVQKKQFPLPQNINGVYFFDAEQQVLIYFFGYTANEVFCSEIQFLQIFNQICEWQIVQYKQYQNKMENGYYYDYQKIIDLIETRSQFSVTKNRVDGFSSQEKNCYILIGGTYFSNECNYGCIIQEVVIAFSQKVYNTKIVQKQKVNQFYKECQNPLLIKMNDTFVLYFEKNGNFNFNNANPAITKICFWKSRQHLIQSGKINFKDNQSFHWFMQIYKYLSSNNKNIRFCQTNTTIENQLNFRILVEDQIAPKQSYLSETKIPFRKFFILTISFFSIKNGIYLDCKQFQVYSHPQLKTIKDFQGEERYELYQNFVENLENTFIFHYDEYDHSYILCYVDQTNKIAFKRFIFYDPQAQDGVFRDYEEIVYQDWAFSKLYLIRKSITFTDCYLNIYECLNSEFFDAKDSQEDILHKIPIKQLYTISDFKSTYQLIGLHIEIKENRSFEGTILTNKNWYQITNKRNVISHTQKKHNKALNVNTQQHFVFYKFKQLYCLFYKKVQFQQAIINEVSQNIVQIKYLFLDSNLQFINGDIIQYSFDEPLSILGPYDGLIGSIKSQDNLIEIIILIKQNNVTFKSQIVCQFNQEKNILEQLNVKSQKPSKLEGTEIFPLIQSNRKKGDYIIKQTKYHSESQSG